MHYREVEEANRPAPAKKQKTGKEGAKDPRGAGAPRMVDVWMSFLTGCLLQWSGCFLKGCSFTTGWMSRMFFMFF